MSLLLALSTGGTPSVPSLGYLQELSRPIIAQRLTATEFGGVFFVAAALPPITPLSPWPGTVQAPRSLAHQSFIVSDPNPKSSTFWFAPLSEPMRPRPALQRDSVDQGVIVPQVSFSWFKDLAEPTRGLAPQARSPAWFQSIFVAASGETITVDKWFTPFGTTNYRISSHALHLSSAALNPLPLPNIAQSGFGWLFPLSEPARSRPRLEAALQQTQASMGPVRPEVSFSWNYGWHDPIRVKPALPTALQQFLAREELPFPNIRDFAWLQALEQPVRIKPALAAALHPFIDTLGPEQPEVGFTWSYAWSDPVRQKPRLETALQMAQDAMGPERPEVSFSWFIQLEQPIKLKPALVVASQPAEQTIFIPVYYPYAKDGPLLYPKSATFWRGRQALKPALITYGLYVSEGYWDGGYSL